MNHTDRSEHLDRLLTGLAMLDAYTDRDAKTLTALVDQISPAEAVTCLLDSIELINGIFAARLGMTPKQVTDSVRRRVVRELADRHQPPGVGRR